MRHKIAALAATAALLAGGALLAAPPASAATPTTWDHIYYTGDGGHGGTVYIVVHGDVVKLCDTDPDGLAPRVEISYTENGQKISYKLTASGGYGTCTEADASMGGWQDQPEGALIHVRVYLGPDYEFEENYEFVNNA